MSLRISDIELNLWNMNPVCSYANISRCLDEKSSRKFDQLVSLKAPFILASCKLRLIFPVECIPWWHFQWCLICYKEARRKKLSSQVSSHFYSFEDKHFSNYKWKWMREEEIIEFPRKRFCVIWYLYFTKFSASSIKLCTFFSACENNSFFEWLGSRDRKLLHWCLFIFYIAAYQVVAFVWLVFHVGYKSRAYLFQNFMYYTQTTQYMNQFEKKDVCIILISVWRFT
jgi:hypothetical protein